MLKHWKWFLLLSAIFALRLAFGLWFAPVQPMEDEIQTTLLGLKYFTTGDWPYYGNDLLTPPGVVSRLIGQDPSPLQALLVGLPLKIWPNPLAPYLVVNLFSMMGLCLLALYAYKRLPRLSPWFVFPWILTAPWCLHYMTSLLNVSYTMAFACLFFVAFLESLPSVSLGWIPRPWTNVLMGFSFSVWFQLHRTWVLILPLLLFSFFRQWQSSRKLQPPGLFILGTLPLLSLMVPTLLLPDYRFSRDVNAFDPAFNPHNFAGFFTVLVQYLAMACFEMPRFIGQHTAERFHFLSEHWLLVPGSFLWYFGFIQVLVLAGFLFIRRSDRPDWNLLRWLTLFLLFFVYFCFLFTSKIPFINNYCEILPLVMLYSLYIWERWWNRPWGRRLLGLTLVFALLFQTVLVFTCLPKQASFYLRYRDVMAQAITQKNYHLLGERRPGYLY